jgi:hypothetical protein
MRKFLLMSTCLLSWTAIPLHAQTQLDTGTAPSKDMRPSGQAPSQERMQPKAATGEGAGTRARGSEQGQAEQERQKGQEPSAKPRELPGEAQKARDAAQPDENAAPSQRSPEAPKSKRENASETGPQQTDDSGRKRQPEDGEAVGKRRAGEPAKPANQDESKAQGGSESDRARGKADQAGQREQKLPNGETPTKNSERTGTEPNRTEGARGEAPSASASGGGNGTARDRGNGQSVRAEGKVHLDERQANDFHSRIVDRYRDESTHIDVSLSVGVAIPPAVRLRPVPTEIVSEYPEFRDYDFFVEDDEVVIVEPSTRRIVEVVGGGGRAEGGMREGGPRLGHDRIEEITRVISSDRAVLAEGGRGPMLRAPADAVLRPLPDRIASSMPDAGAYGYFVDREGRVVVVDRSTREVLDLVE